MHIKETTLSSKGTMQTLSWFHGLGFHISYSMLGSFDYLASLVLHVPVYIAPIAIPIYHTHIVTPPIGSKQTMRDPYCAVDQHLQMLGQGLSSQIY